MLSGCSTLSFYSQAIQGNFSLLRQARPIDEVIADPGVPDAVRARLRVAKAARGFSRSELKLPANRSYETYVEVANPAVVWNVIAAPAFSVQPLQWCYPVTGCVSYRGYFARAEAERYAEELRRDGYDTYVAGASAYSTLGWFDDPIVSTMLRRSEQELVGTIFHELAHQQLYVKGDVAFNEAFAVTVAGEGVRRWYRADPEAYRAWLRDEERQQAISGMLLEARQSLAAWYARPMPESEKAAGKRAILDGLRARYAATRAAWNGDDSYDGWIPEGINNAHLALVDTYQGLVPAFRQLLAREGGDLPRFYAAAAALGRLPGTDRRAELDRLLKNPAVRASLP
jgi:predicted aminopeptidase